MDGSPVQYAQVLSDSHLLYILIAQIELVCQLQNTTMLNLECLNSIFSNNLRSKEKKVYKDRDAYQNFQG